MDSADSIEIEKKSNKKIVFGTLIGYLSLAVQVLSGLLFVPLISGHYGQSQYGLLTLSNSFVGLFMTDIGLSTIANRFLSSYKAEGRQQEIRSLLSIIYKAYMAISAVLLVIFVVLFFFTDLIFAGLNQNEKGPFQAIFIISALGSVASFPMTSFDGVLNAYEEYSFVKAFSIVQKVLYISLVGTAIVFNWPIVAVAAINVGSTLVCCFGKYLVIRVKCRCKADFRSKVSKDFVKGLFGFAAWQAGETILWRLANYTASPILGIVSNSDNIAVFGVASEIELNAFSLASIFTGMFLPKVSRIFAEKDVLVRNQRLYSLSRKAAVLISSLLLLLVVGFAGCGSEFLDVWLDGGGYNAAYLCTIYLMIGDCLVLPNVILTDALYFGNNVKYLFFTNLASLIIFAPLAFVLGYFYGALGMAISILISKLVAAFISAFFYKKRLGLKPIHYYKDIYLKQIFPVAVALAIGLSIHFFVNLQPIFKLLISVFLISIPYVLIEWFFVYTAEMRGTVLSLFARRNKKKNKCGS